MSWEMVKLGDVCKFSQGVQVDVNFQSSVKKEGQILFLRIIDFTQGNQEARYIDSSYGKSLVKEDDISMVRYGATGFVCTGIEGVIANNIFKIEPTIANLNKRFLFFILNSSYIQNFIAGINKGVAMPAISFGTLSEIKIPLPPLPIQKRIAEILDAADALKRKDQELLKKYDELAQAIFIDMFGDPVKNEKGWDVKALNEGNGFGCKSS